MGPPSLAYKVAPIVGKRNAHHPALILLHGRGTDEDDLLDLVPYFDSRFLIFSVRAPFRFRYGGYMWFEIDEMGDANIEQLEISHQYLSNFIDEIQKTRSIDPNNIFLFGFSMGAMIALHLALMQTKQIKGVIAHSGFIPQHQQLQYRLDNLSLTSFLIIHGIRDPIVPIELARRSYEILLQAKADVVYREYSIQHTIDEDSMRDTSYWLQEHLNLKSFFD
jgi:phospholipase/carboxylesterase